MPNYQKIATAARKKVLEMVFKAQTSHIGSNFSAIDILAVLFEKMDPQKDKFICSAGWKAAAVYYFMARKGIIPWEDLDNFCQPGSRYIGLIEPMGLFGAEFAGGSMGYGLPAGVGFALAKKLKGEEGKVYVLMSDGELQCGTTWESALMAGQHNLDNLIVLIDKNGWQAMGKTEEILDLEQHSRGKARLIWPDIPGLGIQRKFLEFKWEAYKCDGHNYSEIEEFILHKKTGPCIIVANTIKGKGVNFMENNNLWHYAQIKKEDYEKALAELSLQ